MSGFTFFWQTSTSKLQSCENPHIHILVLSRYSRLAASSRLRTYQYLPYLTQAGFKLTVSPFLDDSYVRSLYNNNTSKLAVLKAYYQRLRFLFNARQFDLVWVEKEMLPWLPSLFELTLLPANMPLVVDYDDATFHLYDQHKSSLIHTLLGRKIDAVMKRATIVIAGNDYLAEHAKQAGAQRVEQLPTVVDANRYTVIEKKDASPIVIGWIGQLSTVKYLDQLRSVLEKLIARYSVHIVIVGPEPTAKLQHLAIDVRPWSEDSEAAEIAQFDIGIMPLANDLWEKGKCGYKLIQYMACGKPVVASPVGINKVIVRQGENGYLANTDTEWYNALSLLCEDATLRKRMGDAGRKIMEQNYSLQITAPRLIELLHSTVNR